MQTTSNMYFINIVACASIWAVSLMLLQGGNAQIPTVCTDSNSLTNLICCPITEDGVCGMDANRGECVTLNVPGYSSETSDVRRNWPHYFTQVCRCNGNYGGYDCSRCKYGYFGSDCSQKQVLPRRSLAEYSDSDWEEFTSIIRQLKTHNSNYKVVLEESIPGNDSLLMSNISVYNLYIWMHHYSAKDSLNPGKILASI